MPKPDSKKPKAETVQLMSMKSLAGNARLYLGVMGDGRVKLVATDAQHKQPITLIVPAEALHLAALSLHALANQRN